MSHDLLEVHESCPWPDKNGKWTKLLEKSGEKFLIQSAISEKCLCVRGGGLVKWGSAFASLPNKLEVPLQGQIQFVSGVNRPEGIS